MTASDLDRLIPETLEHPYLHFSRADLERVRALCLDGSHAEVYTQTRERLDARLDQPFPDAATQRGKLPERRLGIIQPAVRRGPEPPGRLCTGLYD